MNENKNEDKINEELESVEAKISDDKKTEDVPPKKDSPWNIYKNVKVPIKVLDRVIIFGSIALLAFTIICVLMSN